MILAPKANKVFKGFNDQKVIPVPKVIKVTKAIPAHRAIKVTHLFILTSLLNSLKR